MTQPTQKLSFIEKLGYSFGDAAANFVFMSMILFQSAFYTDVFGLSAATAGVIILVARLWDAFFDPIMGVLADRTNSKMGRFRPWVLFTAVPWAVMMYLAYHTPEGWSTTSLVTYALLTNILLMTLYSMNNMPYSALGGVITADLTERAKLNSYRFIAANIAQFIVGGFTLPLVVKFAGPQHDMKYGWSATMGLWGALCLGLFLVTFLTTKERIQPQKSQQSTAKQDFADLAKNTPWLIMFLFTMIHFGILSMRGGAMYNYFHSYVDKAAMYDWLNTLGLTAGPLAPGQATPSGILEWLGYIVHADRAHLEGTNVADVGNSIFNMLGTGVNILAIMLSPALARKYGKKAITLAGFSLTVITSAAFYLPAPTQIGFMLILSVAWSIFYAPTSPLVWAMFADVADYSEWKTGRRATGVIFATIGFGLKAGLSIGSAGYLWLMGMYGYEANKPQTAQTIEGIRMSSSIYVAILFAVCALLLLGYKINRKMSIQISEELAERRKAQNA